MMKNNPREIEERAENYVIIITKKITIQKNYYIVIYKKENIDVAIKVRETNLQSMK